jgi:NADH dehydrogenase
MAQFDRHPLTNMSLGKKVLATAGLAFGLLLFAGSTWFEVFASNWGASLMNFEMWGTTLLVVRQGAPALFWTLFLAHSTCLILVLWIVRSLFAKVSWSRGSKRALSGLTIVLGIMDLASWLLLSMVPFAVHWLGAIVALEAMCLLVLASRPFRDMWIFRRWKASGGRPKRVVIVGGGFAGLYAALTIDRSLGYHNGLDLIVIDRRNYFLFPPLLPSVASGAIETRQVTYPFRRIFEATNVVFRKQHVERIDVENKVIHSRVDLDTNHETGEVRVVREELAYDYLILAPGSDTNTFNTRGVREHAFFMRELSDAVHVRNQIIDCFEHAAREPDPARRREQLSFVVVGAGPTGVELASEVRDLVEQVLLNRYPEVDAHDVTVTIVQSGKQILPGWHDSVVKSAGEQLSNLEIRVLVGRRVVAVNATSIALDGGESIPTRTCVWCAGVRPSPMLENCALPKHPSGRVEIEQDLRVKGSDHAFVLGDAAFLMHDGKALPPLGQVAFQQGSHAGANVVRLLCGATTKPFRYFNYGALVSVGEHFASVELLGVRLSGFIAWLIWRTLYLAKLVGFSNKLRVVLDWTLDLLVERSISQIAAGKQDVSSAPSGEVGQSAA